MAQRLGGVYDSSVKQRSSIAFFEHFRSMGKAVKVREHPDPTINFILVVAVQQAFHHSSEEVDVCGFGWQGLDRSDFGAFDLALGVWKDTNVHHEVIHPDLVGNRRFLAEIVEY